MVVPPSCLPSNSFASLRGLGSVGPPLPSFVHCLLFCPQCLPLLLHNLLLICLILHVPYPPCLGWMIFLQPISLPLRGFRLALETFALQISLRCSWNASLPTLGLVLGHFFSCSPRQCSSGHPSVEELSTVKLEHLSCVSSFVPTLIGWRLENMKPSRQRHLSRPRIGTRIDVLFHVPRMVITRRQ